MRSLRVYLLFITGTLALSMSSSVSAASLPTATSKIEGPEITGEATFTEEKNGAVRVEVAVQGNPKVLTPGLHGIHLHAVGSCTSGAMPFSGAGGHFDPGPFGSSSPVELNHPYHLGDLPNLVVDKQGRGRLQIVTSRVSLGDSPTTVFDEDGTAVIIHALQDQIKAGGAAAEAGGGRLACGVVQKVEAEKMEKQEKKGKGDAD